MYIHLKEEISPSAVTKIFNKDISLRYKHAMEIWETHCSFIKARKVTRFIKCVLCERLRDGIDQSIYKTLHFRSLRYKKLLITSSSPEIVWDIRIKETFQF